MLVKVTRPYGGQEGRRVKPGTIFSVVKEAAGYQTITRARWDQLKQMRLAVEVKPGEDMPAAPNARPPRAKPEPIPRNRMEPDSRPPPARALKKPGQRAASRRRVQEDTPGEPRPLSRRPGSRAGTQEQPASSSPEVRQAGSVTLRQRGTRRASAGSPSTTPDSPQTSPSETESPPDSAPGLTSSTPATPSGGTDLDPSQEAAAFD